MAPRPDSVILHLQPARHWEGAAPVTWEPDWFPRDPRRRPKESRGGGQRLKAPPRGGVESPGLREPTRGRLCTGRTEGAPLGSRGRPSCRTFTGFGGERARWCADNPASKPPRRRLKGRRAAAAAAAPGPFREGSAGAGTGRDSGESPAAADTPPRRPEEEGGREAPPLPLPEAGGPSPRSLALPDGRLAGRPEGRRKDKPPTVRLRAPGSSACPSFPGPAAVRFGHGVRDGRCPPPVCAAAPGAGRCGAVGGREAASVVLRTTSRLLCPRQAG